MYSLAFKKKAGQLFDIEILLPVAVVVVVPINADEINRGIIRQVGWGTWLGIMHLLITYFDVAVNDHIARGVYGTSKKFRQTFNPPLTPPWLPLLLWKIEPVF